MAEPFIQIADFRINYLNYFSRCLAQDSIPLSFSQYRSSFESISGMVVKEFDRSEAPPPRQQRPPYKPHYSKG